MLTINGKQIEAKNQTLLEAARSLNIDIPTLCHDPRVIPQGNCGLCVVEVENASPKPQLCRACATEAQSGMIVNTESPWVQQTRKTLLELLLSNHTGDCRPPCLLACPAQTDCQGYVSLIANGLYKEAADLIREKLPLPSSIGRICPHPCEKECRRKLVDEPVNIAVLTYFAGDLNLHSSPPEIAPDTGKNAAIIGGGPAGLTAAYFLRLKGHAVTIYDAMPQMGGMLRYGIPEYRLPKKILDAELQLFKQMGINFVNNFRIGKDSSLSDLQKKFGVVVAALGAWRSMPMRCPGEGEFAIGALEFLREPGDLSGKQVVVTGGGFTAMDAARTAVRQNAAKVTIVYRRTKDEMPAAAEHDEAHEEDVIFRFLEAPLEVKANGLRVQKMALGEPDASGRRSPMALPGQEEDISADLVITAIGQALNMEGLEEIPLNSWGAIEVEENSFRTPLTGIFAVGDAINRGGIAIEAISHAQNAVWGIHKYLMDNNWDAVDVKPPLVKDTKTEDDFADHPKLPRQNVSHLAPEARIKSYEEVSLGLTEEQACQEASRCLSCGCADYFECKLIQLSHRCGADPEAYISPVKIISAADTSHPHFDMDPNKCILCGLCSRGCEEVAGKSVFSIVHRGYPSRVTTAFDEPITDTDCIGCGQCAAMCPTGALAESLPVTVAEDSVESVCAMCSMGCLVVHTFRGGIPLRTLPHGPSGILCARGRFALNGLRCLKRAVCKNPGEIAQKAREGLLDIAAKHGGSSVGIAIGGFHTNEDIAALLDWARRDFPQAHIFTFNGLDTIESETIEPVKAGGVIPMAYGNSQGLANAGIKKYNGQKLHGLIIFGECPPADLPNVEFLAISNAAMDIKKADVFLPGITFAETSGTYTSAKGKIQTVRAVIPCAAGYSPGQWSRLMV